MFLFWVIPRRLNIVCRRFGTHVGIQNSDAGELPRRKKHTTFTTRRKFEIKKVGILTGVAEYSLLLECDFLFLGNELPTFQKEVLSLPSKISTV
jgi:hypothetical protein